MDVEFDNQEKEVLKELRKVAGNNALKIEDILEWGASELDEVEGQVIYFLPTLKLYASVESKMAKMNKKIKVDDVEFPDAGVKSPPATSVNILKTNTPDKTPPDVYVAPPLTTPAVEGKPKELLEKQILDEVIMVSRDATLTSKNILAWGIGRISAGEIGEQLFFLPDLQLHVLIKK